MSPIRYVACMGRTALTGPATEYIAGELRAQQARRGWTLDDIVKRTGIKRSTVDRALKGESAIAVEVIIPLCQGMGLDVARLISEAASLR